MSAPDKKKRSRKSASWTELEIQRLSIIPALIQKPQWHAHQVAFKWMFFVILATVFAISYFADWSGAPNIPGMIAIPSVGAPVEQKSAEQTVDGVNLGQGEATQGSTDQSEMSVFDRVAVLFQNVELALPAVQSLEGSLLGYVALGVLVAIEGPIATLFGAAAAAAGALDLPWVFLAAIIGNLCADITWYWIGRSGRLDRVARYGRWIRLKPEQVYQLSGQLEQNATKVLFFAKITAGLVIPALMAAGLVRAPWRKWFPPIFVGETVWTGALVLIGYYATSLLFQVERTIGYIIIGASAIFFVAIVIAVRRALRRTDPANHPPE